MSPAPAVRRPFRSLSTTLIRWIVTAGALCTIGVAALQVLVTYRVEREKFESEVQTIVEINVPLLSVSVWDIEPDAVRRQLRLIAQRPQIAHVRLDTATGQEFESGVPSSRGAAGTVTLEIPYPAGKPGRLGTLAVTPNTRHLYGELVDDVLRVLLGCVLLTALICAVVFVILRRLLQRPLRQIGEFASSLTPADLTRPLKLDRGRRRWRDEIDELTEGFAVLQDDIRRHVEELDSQVAARTADLRRANAQLETLARRDPLTGLANRRRFEHEKSRAWDDMFAHRQPLSVLMVDLDYFKNYNDQYGHAAGDECLAEIGHALSVEFHSAGELAVRVGGEEFAVMLENVSSEAARARAETLRRAVEALQRPHARSPHGRVTVSIGIATIEIAELTSALATAGAAAGIGGLLKQADEALYAAKAQGRNAVVAMKLASARSPAAA